MATVNEKDPNAALEDLIKVFRERTRDMQLGYTGQDVMVQRAHAAVDVAQFIALAYNAGYRLRRDGEAG